MEGMYQPSQATQETEGESETTRAHKFKTSLVNIGTLSSKHGRIEIKYKYVF